MMNTKVYKAVHDLAEELMNAANKNDRKRFELLFSKLKAICEENENTSKDHPVQWETLADFTEELEEAITTYEKALAKSIAINNKDHMSSVAFSMATLQLELGQKEEAIKNLQSAKVSANKIEDKELKAEIHDLLESLVEEEG
ncbi:MULTISPECIES: tetratricopeptide repeat protein [unclassified Pseudoalteromonas]|jgi:tetratricopeptide (TPR) repeat protein|uniref:tetratricopeptide repeat protein n=1 Tax=unclassified Pseudoalteromonas TaxID=194690 RepID=UPI0007322549|nr:MULTISPECIES: tetratricopeptide repeat protein [unclassified Pseudoalteromonas]KTF14444.1 Replicative DNA helicase [Pseudoalteromonas sp. 10-33]MBW4967681.1 tetratricopeptide repeat protein [Pseudoalteromonas sp. CR1]TMN82814.1 o-succinylbenzoate synthase [Pseudoalteromonas sp. S410]TMN92609.1 o-succinylbenzoate synthase [Pseudoalteromonas sp. S408]TMN97599.1 o-succinylbenzoate synthase [Pseudoalteromonas sp. S409]